MTVTRGLTRCRSHHSSHRRRHHHCCRFFFCTVVRAPRVVAASDVLKRKTCLIMSVNPRKRNCYQDLLLCTIADAFHVQAASPVPLSTRRTLVDSVHWTADMHISLFFSSNFEIFLIFFNPSLLIAFFSPVFLFSFLAISLTSKVNDGTKFRVCL